ncbi:sporulation membrane protein YtaF [Alicyclobacillus contaminans]|uniref:sporulation membrane protein YtaF n=1 Tax=Alicyclobacillus contaminans TaxID=392016 RepID=UPI0004145F26|nr:sporulation membrane protein YtaF [Alicyclobacillus contaminans]GMA50568.1 sporulation membrane protein YtaF [Alicyclobacillus contaminans]
MGATFVTIIAIAVASNLDNAGVGIAYGVRRIAISRLANVWIALISGLATYVSGVAGDTVTRYVTPWAAAWIGGTVMLAVGAWVCSEPCRKRRQQRLEKEKTGKANVVKRILEDPVAADFDRSQTISLKEATVLGIALAINALAGGFDAGVVHIGIVWTAFSVALCSYALLGASAWVGRKYAARALGDRATYIAGLLLMFIGLHQIW